MKQYSDIISHYKKKIKAIEATQLQTIVLKMTKNAKKMHGLWFLDTVEEHLSGQRGLFFCSLPLDAIINGREQRDGEPIRSRLACQPKTNCLLALTAGFYLHNSNPKAKAICTLPTPTSGAVFTRRHMEESRGKKRTESNRATMNETLRQDESIAVTITL